MQTTGFFRSLQMRLCIHGGVAQLGEHLPCKQGVKGSNPFISTKEQIERCGLILSYSGFEVGCG